MKSQTKASANFPYKTSPGPYSPQDHQFSHRQRSYKVMQSMDTFSSRKAYVDAAIGKLNSPREWASISKNFQDIQKPAYKPGHMRHSSDPSQLRMTPSSPEKTSSYRNIRASLPIAPTIPKYKTNDQDYATLGKDKKTAIKPRHMRHSSDPTQLLMATANVENGNCSSQRTIRARMPRVTTLLKSKTSDQDYFASLTSLKELRFELSSLSTNPPKSELDFGAIRAIIQNLDDFLFQILQEADVPDEKLLKGRMKTCSRLTNQIILLFNSISKRGDLGQCLEMLWKAIVKICDSIFDLLEVKESQVKREVQNLKRIINDRHQTETDALKAENMDIETQTLNDLREARLENSQLKEEREQLETRIMQKDIILTEMSEYQQRTSTSEKLINSIKSLQNWIVVDNDNESEDPKKPVNFIKSIGTQTFQRATDQPQLLRPVSSILSDLSELDLNISDEHIIQLCDSALAPKNLQSFYFGLMKQVTQTFHGEAQILHAINMVMSKLPEIHTTPGLLYSKLLQPETHKAITQFINQLAQVFVPGQTVQLSYLISYIRLLFATDKEMGSDILSALRVPLSQFPSTEQETLTSKMTLSPENRQRLELLLNRVAARINGKEDEFEDQATSFSHEAKITKAQLVYLLKTKQNWFLTQNDMYFIFSWFKIKNRKGIDSAAFLAKLNPKQAQYNLENIWVPSHEVLLAVIDEWDRRVDVALRELLNSKLNNVERFGNRIRNTYTDMTTNDVTSLFCALLEDTIDYKRIPDIFFLSITPAIKN